MARKLPLSFVCVVLFLFVGNIYCWLESIMGDVCSGCHLGSTKPGLGTHPPASRLHLIFHNVDRRVIMTMITVHMGWEGDFSKIKSTTSSVKLFRMG